MNRNAGNMYSAKISKSVGITGFLLMALALLLPGQVFAQTCPATLSVGFTDSPGPFELGEKIPITLTIDMGFPGQTPTSVDINHFQYFLDCAADDVFPSPGCTSQGNGVSFIKPVSTTCPLPPPPTPPNTATLAAQVAGNQVDFYVRNDGDDTNYVSNDVIRLDSVAEDAPPNSCTVEFEVQIDSLAVPNSQDPIVEFSFWGGLDAECDNEATSTETDSLTIPIVNPNAVFWVTKDFSDDNEMPVDIHIQCDTGIYTNPDFQITDPAAGGPFPLKGFVVYGIPSIGTNCRVWETPVSGYAGNYTAGAEENGLYDTLYDVDEGDDSDEPLGCYFKAVTGGDFTCDIINNAKPAMFTVNKEWEIYNEGGEYVNEVAEVTIYCDSPIMKEYPENGAASLVVEGPPYKQYGELGDGDSLSVMVSTLTGPAECWATEEVIESGVESTDDCDSRSIPAGGSSECTFVNTVFFEGIPTLNQYGMALMALLMLGIGVLGLRRFS